MSLREQCSLVVTLCPRQNRGMRRPAVVGGGVTEAAGSSRFYTRGRKESEATRHRPHGGKQRWSSQMASRGGGPFYRGDPRDRQDGSGWRLVLGRARTARSCTSGRRHAARRTVAGDLCGDDAEGMLSLCRCPSHTGNGGAERCPRGTRRLTSTRHL
jgi:hypothetical protein